MTSLVRIPDAPALSPALAYVARMQKSSAQRQWYALQTIVGLFTSGASNDPATFPWHTLQYTHSNLLRTALAERYSPATVNRLLSAYRGVLKECFRLGLLTEDARARLADVMNVRSENAPAGRMITRDEVRALYAACLKSGNLTGVRDAAIVAVLDGGGVRRSELAGVLYPEGWLDAEGEATLVVMGKGRKMRKAPLPASSAKRVREWIRARGPWTGALFCKVVTECVVEGSTLSDNRIHAIVKKRCEEVGIEGLTPHDFRRTVITRLLDKNVDIAQVGRIVGHASPTTTVRYDRRGDEQSRAAIERLDEE